MNLNAYDAVNPIFTTTWVVPENKKLYSDVIPFYSFYTFLSKYNNKTEKYDYYIAFSNSTTKDKEWYRVYKTKSNSIKVDLYPIWNKSPFVNIKRSQEINIEVEDTFEDGVIYYLDI